MGRRLYQNNEDNFKGFNCKQVFFQTSTLQEKLNFLN